MKKTVFFISALVFSLFFSGILCFIPAIFWEIFDSYLSVSSISGYFFYVFPVFFLLGFTSLTIIDRIYKEKIGREIKEFLNISKDNQEERGDLTPQIISEEIKSSLTSHFQQYEEVEEVIGHLIKEKYSLARESISLLTKNNALSQSVALLVDNLTRKQEEEQERNWFNEGMSKFSEILSQSELDVTEFCDKLISEMVKFTHCNQGALFLTQEDKPDKEVLILQSCYAYQRKKYIEKKIEKGMGLAGQCWLEGEAIILNEIPPDYIKITSGLGEALPSHIMMIPLVYNNRVEGVIELASFGELTKNEIDFVQKASENIAAQIQSKKINAEIKKLLEISENKTRQLLKQEEELRQNSEEILTQREDLERKVELQKRSIEKLQSSEDSVVINVAGRQRMLTQQMAFYATMLYHGKMDIKPSLQETVDLFDHSLHTLENGGIFKGVEYDGEILAAKGKMREKLLQVKKVWQPLHKSINVLLSTNYHPSSILVSKERTLQQIQYVEDNIGALLNANHELTQAYVDESFSWRKKIFEDMESLLSDTLLNINGNENGHIVSQLAPAGEEVS